MTKLQEFVAAKEKEIEPLSSVRLHNPAIKRDEKRSDADIDYSRILYSSSFRRLQGKMQLLVPDNNNFYRNRLTHSLEVSQIARSIAQRIGMTDTFTVQCCALAHDVGNPPFGHAGERALSKCDAKYQYEGNAQTFRILTNIEDKFHDCNGLNLTMRTLLGTVKYPSDYQSNPEKFLYDADYVTVEKWRADKNFSWRTIDCQVMDLADEIAYAAHDLEDSLKLKLFSIEELLFEFSISKYKDCTKTLQELVEHAREYASKAKAYETSEEYSILFRKEFTSSLVNLLVTDIGVVEKNNHEELGYINHECIARGLKKLTFKTITRNPEIILYEHMGDTIIKGLFEVYIDEGFNKSMMLLPAEYRSDSDRVRTILDYIGGMMDSYAIEQYRLYYGANSLDAYRKIKN